MEAPQTSNHIGDFDKWCDDTRPHMLSTEEWCEMMAIPAIRESWGLEPDETPEHFAKQVYAAKYHFQSGSPVQGDILTGDAPVVLLRDKDGKLKFAD